MKKRYLIYFIKSGKGGPYYVASTLLNFLIKNADSLPFTLRVINHCYNNIKLNPFTISIIKLYKLLKTKCNVLIHIPFSPLFAATIKQTLATFLSLINGNKLIINYHGDVRYELSLFRLNKNYFKYVIDIPNVLFTPFILSQSIVIVNSYKMAHIVNNQYNINHSLHVIPNALDEWWYTKLNFDTSLELEGDPIIFYHGRLAYEKGIDLLLRAFIKVFRKVSRKARLYIAGQGPLINFVKNISIKYKNRIVYLGYVSKYHLRDILQNSDYTIYPSRYEPFSLAILEALAASNSTVCFSNQAGIIDFISVSNLRYLVTFRPSLDNLVKLLINIFEDTYEKRIKQQKRVAEKFRTNRIYPIYIKLYNYYYEQDIF